jgi:hypothetical protein
VGWCLSTPANYKSVNWAEYEQLSDNAPTSIVWASTGPEGSGKSYFGLTAPGPIFVCAFDSHGMNRVDKSVKVGKDIRIARYPFSRTPYGSNRATLSAAAGKVWDRFMADYRMALRNSRTVLIDREDLAWEMLRYTELGGDSAAPKDYADSNTEYISMVQEAYAAGVNLGLLRGVKEQWLSQFDPTKGKKVPMNTGVLIPDGFRKVPDLVDITLSHRWDPALKEFVTKIGKFTQKEWMDVEFPDLTFAQMAMAAYPDTTEEQWL